MSEILLDLWTGMITIPDGVEVHLYAVDELEERNETYEVQAYRPDLLLVGDDGGGRGFFVTRGEQDPEVTVIEHGAIGSDDGFSLGRLSQWVDSGFMIVEPRPDFPFPLDPVDILITGRPSAGVKAFVEIRRTLHLDLPLSQLTDPAAEFPVVVLQAVRMAKYAAAYTALNDRFGCLGFRLH